MVTKTRRQHYSMVAVICAILMAFSFLMSSIYVSADTTSTAQYSEKVYNSMGTYADKTYSTTGGGSYKMSDLLYKSTETSTKDVYLVNEKRYNELKSSAQTEFLTDLNTIAQKVIADDATGQQYTDESLTNWYAILQQQDGVGSKMLNMILANTKPDFVTANKIYAPFSGLVGTVLGLGAVLIMAFLAIVMVCDIAYIALPPVRLFAGEESERGAVKSKLFSHDATYAVQVAENSDGGDGNPKQALGIYFKRRVVMLILLGICLLYLIQGQIFSLVGMILDLVSGFFGS